MRGLLTTTICAAAILGAGCGSGDGDETSTEARSSEPAPALTKLPQECHLDDVEALLTGFIGAVNSGNKGVVESYVAPQPELYRLTLYAGPGPGDGALDPRTPAEVYEGMTRLAHGEDFALVGAAVGIPPLAGERSGPRAGDPAAGADFTYDSERRSITGKVGFNCASGRIYTGAMGVHPGPGSRVFCGRRLPVDVKEPVVCAYDY